ncbi:MAG: cobalamin-dependent protein [Proteobacteria bacterium]|nr:cobalamin-dependent protein [Pseudomonadota bacterium]
MPVDGGKMRRAVARDVLEPRIASLEGKRVLLINPPWTLLKGNIWRAVASCYPSIGLALIAAYLEHCGAAVTLLDMQAEGADDGWPSRITQRPDIIGLTATTVIFDRALAVAEMARRAWPDVPIVLGGVHSTIAPREVLENHCIDYVIRGEGERSMALLAAGVPPDGIPGLAFIRNGEYWEHPDVDVTV